MKRSKPKLIKHKQDGGISCSVHGRKAYKSANAPTNGCNACHQLYLEGIER